MTRCRRSACLGLAPLACAPSRLLPRELPLLRGSLIGGPVWFSLPGRGFPPRAPPRAISPTVRWVGWCGEVHIRDRLSRPAFPGILLRSGVWDGAGVPGRLFRRISRLLPPPWGGGDRRAVYDGMPAKGIFGAGVPSTPRPTPRHRCPHPGWFLDRGGTFSYVLLCRLRAGAGPGPGPSIESGAQSRLTAWPCGNAK